MIKVFIVIQILFALFIISGCSRTGILSTGAGTTMVVAEGEKSMGDTIDDATIKIQIGTKFIASKENLFLDIDTSVTKGRVLLTGIVDTQEIRINAVRRVWDVKGVQEVINEIEVGDKTTLKEYSKDLWINTQITGRAAKNLGMRSLGDNFETIKGKVYIAGITSKREQLDLLINLIENIKGVTEIANYVIVKEK